MKHYQDTFQITESSGNVFQDLGYENAKEHLLKVEIVMIINHIIDNDYPTQSAAAKALGIDQPKVSLLNRGRISGFSLSRLFEFLSRLKQDVSVKITPHLPSLSLQAGLIMCNYEASGAVISHASEGVSSSVSVPFFTGTSMISNSPGV